MEKVIYVPCSAFPFSLQNNFFFSGEGEDVQCDNDKHYG